MVTAGFQTNQVKNVQVRTGAVRTGQVRTGQIRTGQVMTGQIRTGQVKIGQVRTVQVRTYTWNSSVALLSPTCLFIINGPQDYPLSSLKAAHYVVINKNINYRGSHC